MYNNNTQEIKVKVKFKKKKCLYTRPYYDFIFLLLKIMFFCLGSVIALKSALIEIVHTHSSVKIYIFENI